MNKTSKRFFITLGLVLIALVIFLIFQFNKDSNNDYTSDSDTTITDGETIVFLGGGNAPNEILFLFDYSCPWCTVWIDDILPEFDGAISSGDVKLRTQGLSLLNPISLKLAEVDQQLKVHYANDYFEVFQALIKDSTEMEITDEYLEELASEYELDSEVLLGNTDLDMTHLTNQYVDDYELESVPTVIVNGEKVDDPFDIEAIEALLVEEK